MLGIVKTINGVKQLVPLTTDSGHYVKDITIEYTKGTDQATV